MKLTLASVYPFVFFCLLLASCSGSDNGGGPDTVQNPPAASVPAISYTLGATIYRHDTASFTEGLGFYGGKLWESTGLEGKSFILQTDLATGRIEKRYPLDSSLFGEGIVVLNDTLYQLTWRNHKAFAYDFKTMKRVKEYALQPEGWGITTDGKVLIATDGSSNLYFYEPGTMRLLRTQGVSDVDGPVANLNEIEWVNGMLYANVWQKDVVLKIDPASGQVLGRLDISQLAQRARMQNPNAEVANGIAYDPETKKFYVTGKNWPELYELKFAF